MKTKTTNGKMPAAKATKSKSSDTEKDGMFEEFFKD